MLARIALVIKRPQHSYDLESGNLSSTDRNANVADIDGPPATGMNQKFIQFIPQDLTTRIALHDMLSYRQIKALPPRLHTYIEEIPGVRTELDEREFLAQYNDPGNDQILMALPKDYRGCHFKITLDNPRLSEGFEWAFGSVSRGISHDGIDVLVAMSCVDDQHMRHLRLYKHFRNVYG